MTSPRGKINKAPFAALSGWPVSSFFWSPRWCCGWCSCSTSGDFTDKTKLTMLSDRAGLVMDPGSKVTYNGVQIGRVAKHRRDRA